MPEIMTRGICSLQPACSAQRRCVRVCTGSACTAKQHQQAPPFAPPQDAAGFGWEGVPTSPALNWSKMVEAKNKEIARLHGVYGNILKVERFPCPVLPSEPLRRAMR